MENTSRRRPIVPFLPIIVDPNATSTLHRQLYEGLRNAILSGQIPGGGILPSTRSLARHLHISRTTVITAYDQLIAEGYLESKVGAGTFVTETLPDRYLAVRGASPRIGLEQADRELSARAERFRGTTFGPLPASIIPVVPEAFPPGLPALKAFPMAEWQRLVSRCYRTLPRGRLSYGDPAGYRPLREALANHLKLSRGVQCDCGQIIITSGAQQALSLCAQLLLDAGDNVWIEDPGYVGARRAFAGAGATLVPVPVDDEGIDIDEGIKACANARMAYVTPSHQFPMGVTMKLSRRLALLEWAQQARGWIIEDDYDSELSFTGRPLPSLQGLDTHDRVIYIGTLSKVLFPALRLGYIVVPPDLVDAFLAAYTASGGQAPIIEQMVTAAFIAEGEFERHVRRMRNLYADRQRAFLDGARQLEGICTILPSEAGMHLIGMLPEGLSDLQAARQAAKYGVNIPPLSMFSLRDVKLQGLLFGYAAADEATIGEGIARLITAFNDLH